MSLMSKTELMKMVVEGKVHESFEHSVDGIFDVTAMREQAVKNKAPIVTFTIADVVDHVRADRVVDEERIGNLPEASWRSDPAMVVLFDQGDNVYHLLIDGSHRILRRHREGLFNFPCYLIPSSEIIRPDPEQWVRGEERGLVWGDAIVDGKIVKR